MPGGLGVNARAVPRSRRADEHAHRLITAVIGPATSRLREAGGLRPDITADDIATFIRMTDSADSEDSRAKAIEVMLAGLTRPAEYHAVNSGGA